MDRTKISKLRLFLLASTAMFIISSCARATTIQNSTQSLTPLPLYLHYSPSETSNIRVEFDYPSLWLFSEEKVQDTNIVIVGLGDPRFLTVPTRAPYESHGAPNDFGNLSIITQPVKPGQTPDTELQFHKQAYSKTPWMLTILNDYKIKIDGYDASVLEYQSNDLETSPSLMFIRRIFFMINNQAYEIIFEVAEKERGGEFEQGYEYFFKSLKVVRKNK